MKNFIQGSWDIPGLFLHACSKSIIPHVLSPPHIDRITVAYFLKDSRFCNRGAVEMRVHRSENEIQGCLHATHPLLVLPRKLYVKILSPLSTTRSWKREHPGCNSTTQENSYCGIFVAPRSKRWLAFSSHMVNYSSN